ncbi:MAG TPA: aldose 1-epimerase [Acidobacteriaceae bacterium]|nr:aldose 1-epimerase [Acidobacteriaceae bacterium]
MSYRPQFTLMLAAAVLFSVAGCKQAPAPQPAPAAQPSATAPAEIGGEQVVHLKSTATPSGDTPQFLSATILPGRGMNVFEITAYLPGKGVVKVLASPSLAEAADKLNGGPGDEYGNASFSFGGAFLVPYPNRILGTLSADRKTIALEWHGKTVTLPANWPGKKPTDRPVAMHGLILNVKAQDVKVMPIPGGQQLTATIHAGDFCGHWFSNTDLEFTLSLTGSEFDAKIRALNMGKEAEPIAIGWHPYFNIPSGDRAQARVHVPATQIAAVNNYDEVFPTGKLAPVKGTRWDFNAPDGAALDGNYYDDNWSNLKRTDGVVDVRLTDPADDYGVQVEGVAPEIKTVQVYSPPTAKFAAIEEQFNFSDPFGKEWHGVNTGMVTLKPGQSVMWHVRLALFTPPYKK